MTIGERVRECRIKKGMTQTELAEKLGYKSKSSITHIESGRDIPRGMVAELAAVLDTTPSHLMGWDELPPTSPLTTPEQQLLDLFRQLNGEGQREAVKLVGMLVQTGSYKKTDTNSVGDIA